MGQVYQCCCPSFEYHMFYVLYPLVTYDCPSQLLYIRWPTGAKIIPKLTESRGILGSIPPSYFGVSGLKFQSEDRLS
jgi:hypothetical protein